MAQLPDPCTSADIRQRLEITQDWWAHNWRTLIERHGFPQPIPGFRRPFKWNPAHVEAWLAKHHDWLGRPPAAARIVPPPANRDDALQLDGTPLDDTTFAARARAIAAAKNRKPAKVA
jgi:hypothetical protein